MKYIGKMAETESLLSTCCILLLTYRRKYDFLLLNLKFSVECFVDHCLSFFLLAMVLSVFQIKTSYYLFRIFIFFLVLCIIILQDKYSIHVYAVSYKILYTIYVSSAQNTGHISYIF